jgi:hypothetical protein
MVDFLMKKSGKPEKRFNLEIFSREIAESLLEISKMSPKKRTFA